MSDSTTSTTTTATATVSEAIMAQEQQVRDILTAAAQTTNPDGSSHGVDADVLAVAVRQAVELGVTPADIALEVSWYGPGTELDMHPVDCDGIQVAHFRSKVGHTPRCSEELEAYSNSAEEHDAYQAANPYTPVQATVEEKATEPTTTPKSVAPHASMRPMSVKAPEAGLSARKLLAKFVRSCANQGRQTLEQGLLGLAYIRARLAESDKLTRDVAVKELVTSWQGYSDSEVTAARVSTLIQYGATWELLSKDYVPCVPVLAVVKAFSLAAWRNTAMEASRKEEWLLTAKTADAVKALWREAGEASLPGTACDKALRDILGMPAKEEKPAPKPATATPEAPKADATTDTKATKATTEAEATTDGKLPQWPVGHVNHPDTVHEDYGTEEDKHGEPPCAQPAVQLLKGASQATVKDLAGQLSDMLMAHPEPDSVLEELLGMLHNNPELSKGMQRALNAARLVLENNAKRGPSPVEVASLLPTKAELNHVVAVA